MEVNGSEKYLAEKFYEYRIGFLQVRYYNEWKTAYVERSPSGPGFIAYAEELGYFGPYATALQAMAAIDMRERKHFEDRDNPHHWHAGDPVYVRYADPSGVRDYGWERTVSLQVIQGFSRDDGRAGFVKGLGTFMPGDGNGPFVLKGALGVGLVWRIPRDATPSQLAELAAAIRDWPEPEPDGAPR